ncbi:MULTISPECIES: ABC transporter permease subunit [Microvirgula]|uniref:ABC transporter ATP-binding protein n=1 Tax=Microvirgula aerodenitrificans TaxID=57480 RepID=A0A2U3THA6_9NEIS|nr:MULTISPECIES: ABC transporter ATP-binding protein [Microvirgula]AVY92791.1 ABC transporter ATP-binding protein [Microvirgula aerodenitrificans]RAS17537.1 amino acid/amide ABC transporter membrane protein 2 (HAAT family) [Microvirgula sp. AG722]
MIQLSKGKQFALFVACGILLAVLPFLVGNTLGNSWVRTLDFALLYIMLALGLNIVVGFAGLLDLGYIAFYAVGAYSYALLNSPHFDIFWPWWILLPIGAICAAFFGILLGTPVLKLRGDYLAIVTLGFGEIVRIFMNNLNAPINITNGPQGVNMIQPVTVAGVSLGKSHVIFGYSLNSVYLYYYLFLALTILTVIICSRLQHSRIGRAWVALREDDIAASAMGLNIRNIKLLAFALGATFGGVSGGLFASFQGFVSPESFGLLESIMVLSMVVLGGMGHIPGVILGAVLLTITPEILRDVIGPVQMAVFGKMLVDPENARMLLFGLALILVMLLRPEGLWPNKRRKAEFHDALDEGVPATDSQAADGLKG